MKLSLTTWRLLKKKLFPSVMLLPYTFIYSPDVKSAWCFSFVCTCTDSCKPSWPEKEQKTEKEQRFGCSAVVRISCLLSLYCAQLDLTFWVGRDVLLLSGLTEDGWVSFSLFSPVGFQETQHHQQDFPHKFLTATRTKIMMVPLNPPAHQWHIMVVVLALFLEVFHLV